MDRTTHPASFRYPTHGTKNSFALPREILRYVRRRQMRISRHKKPRKDGIMRKRADVDYLIHKPCHCAPGTVLEFKNLRFLVHTPTLSSKRYPVPDPAPREVQHMVFSFAYSYLGTACAMRDCKRPLIRVCVPAMLVSLSLRCIAGWPPSAERARQSSGRSRVEFVPVLPKADPTP